MFNYMEPKFIRKTFQDEWIKTQGTALEKKLRQSTWPIYYFLTPLPVESYTFLNYVLGWRCVATQAELKKIERNDLFAQPFISIRPEDRPVTFAEVLSPEWIPETNPSQLVLMQTEARIRSVCLTWTHFFESMTEAV
jgi:hypothetical protein